MARVSVVLAVLLVVLTFNAYACILPLPQPPAMDCSSDTDKSERATCDAFLELGPQSHVPSHGALDPFHLPCVYPAPLAPGMLAPLSHATESPPPADSSLHVSVPTTILRI